MEREVKKAREKSIKAMEKKKERQWKQLDSGGERKSVCVGGGCHPWLPLITHSLMTLFFFLFPLLFHGRGWRGREFVRGPIKRGHTEFTSSRWDCPPPGKCLYVVKDRLDKVWDKKQNKTCVRINVNQVVVKLKLTCKKRKNNSFWFESLCRVFFYVWHFCKHG